MRANEVFPATEDAIYLRIAYRRSTVNYVPSSPRNTNATFGVNMRNGRWTDDQASERANERVSERTSAFSVEMRDRGRDYVTCTRSRRCASRTRRTTDARFRSGSPVLQGGSGDRDGRVRRSACGTEQRGKEGQRRDKDERTRPRRRRESERKGDTR